MPALVWTCTAQLTSARALKHAAMQREARTVDARAFVKVLVHGNLDQIGGGHLGVKQLMALHEEVARLARPRIDEWL